MDLLKSIRHPNTFVLSFCLRFGVVVRQCDIPIHRLCKMNECLCVFIRNSSVYITQSNDSNNDDVDINKEDCVRVCVARLHKHKTK